MEILQTFLTDDENVISGRVIFFYKSLMTDGFLQNTLS